MKIIEQYIIAIGRKLPLKGRKDIKKELNGLLMDEIDAKHGSNPSESDVKAVITNFGSPTAVAKKYAGEQLAISAELTDIYFLVNIILVFGILVSQSTIFIIEMIKDNYLKSEIFINMLMIPVNSIPLILSGIGSVSLVFIVMSRISKEFKFDIEENWTPEALNGISIESQKQSKWENIIPISLMSFFIILLNVCPQIMTAMENSVAYMRLDLGHRIHIDRFTSYVLLISVIWLVQIIYHLMLLKTELKTKSLVIVEFILSILEAVVFAIMLLDSRLYQFESGMIGLKVIFAIFLVVNLAETLSRTVRYIHKIIIDSQQS